MDQWSKEFLAFLRDANYQNTTFKIHNLTNLFNLLFLPECRHKHLGQSPSPDSLIQYMKENGCLSAEGEDLRIAPENFVNLAPNPPA